MRIMRDIPAARVRAGGALGPVAAFLYVTGFLVMFASMLVAMACP